MKRRKLKTPLISGDKVATHEEWVDMSGAGHYDWCPVWEERVYNKTISFKEIKNTHSFLRDNGLNIVEGKLPYDKRELESWDNNFTLKVLKNNKYEDYKSIKINYYALIKKLGQDENTIMSDAGFNEVQEGRRKYWVGYVYSNGSSDGFRNSCGHKREVSLMDAIRVLYPKELEKEEERVETLKKEFLNKNSKELVFDFSDYKITE